MTNPQGPIPMKTMGVGLKPDHYEEALSRNHGLGFFEVHAENFMGAGGPPHRWLSAIRERFPLSIHGVCLSIGSPDPLNRDHLQGLKALVDRYDPALVSEHLAWTSENGVFYNDLLPGPLTEDAFRVVKTHVEQTQDTLQRQILIENPSLYLKLLGSTIPETAFLNKLAEETGCGLLLDINNAYVSAMNTGFSAEAYVDAINPDHVKEIHLAGHIIDHFEDIELLVDNHGRPVSPEVMKLYQRFIKRAGPHPTLIEWDTDVPSFSTLVEQTERATLAVKEATGELTYA